MDDMEVSKGIVVHPHRCGGVPTIRGTRITAAMVARLLSGDRPMSPLAIVTDYPSLTYTDLANVLAWARRGRPFDNP